MEFKILFDDGQGNIVDEDGNDPMAADYPELDKELEMLTNMEMYSTCQYEQNQQKEEQQDETMTQQQQVETASKHKKRHYNSHSEDVKSIVIDYHLEKLVSAAQAGKKYGVAARVAQRWIKEYKESVRQEEPENNKKKPGPKPRLGDEHKRHLIEFIDDNPSAIINQAVDSLTKQFEGLVIKKTVVHEFMKNECNLSLKKAHFHPLARNSNATIEKRYEWVLKWMNTDMDFTTNCVFIDEAAFNINQRRTFAWAEKGDTPIVKVAKTRAISHTILGAISVAGVVNISIRKPRTKQKRQKRGRNGEITTTKRTTGTTTEHYVDYLVDTMDVMDRYPEFKGFYLVMDNAPIHKALEIQTIIEERGYRCIYLPPYSPELNPIEQFWSKVKYSTKRNLLMKDETLSTRISEACNMVTHKDLQGYARYSAARFSDCLKKSPM